MKLPKGYIFCELTFGSDQFRWQLLSFADTEAAFEALVCQIASGWAAELVVNFIEDGSILTIALLTLASLRFPAKAGSTEGLADDVKITICLMLIKLWCRLEVFFWA